mmetsp:Transcript_24022/g.71267  ORF Transcript_24022/g.71267 Transcript_24022/m.71267 type:complete len:284 (-) Transcript_24022:2446-3297(-)
MSLCTPQLKRTFDDAEREGPAALGFPAPKRVRKDRAGPGGASLGSRCGDAPVGLSPSSLLALTSIFPGMEEQTLVAVLSDCGDNIDQAIKVLGQLRLVADDAGPSTGPSSGQATPGRVGTPLGLDEDVFQQHQQQQRLPTEQVASSSHGLQSPDDWVDALVREMASATSVDNARARAAVILSEFAKWSAAQQHGSAEKSMLLAKLNDVQRENHILKRAVQIQNAKLNEKSAAEAELGQMSAVMAQYREQIRTLELSNYSLTMHLQQATAGGTLEGSGRPPDVY